MPTTPRKSRPAALLSGFLVAAAAVAGGCAFLAGGVRSVAPGPGAVVVTSPVKAHLVNGYTVLYPAGVRIASDSVSGTGTMYDLRLMDRGLAPAIPLDSVVGMETYTGDTDTGASAVGSGLTLLMGMSLAVGLLVAATWN